MKTPSVKASHNSNAKDDLPNSVLIVEDKIHTCIRLKDTIETCDALSVCAISHTLDAGLNALFDHKPRLVLTDLGLPDGSGFEIIDAVRQADWICESLVISVFGDETRVIKAIRKGAKGYILKNSDERSISEDILTVLHGGCPISPQIARHLLSLVNNLSVENEPDNEQINLTARESEILREVSRGYKRSEIGQNLGISTGTVGIHINNIYKKLEVNSNIEAVTLATKMGLL